LKNILLSLLYHAVSALISSATFHNLAELCKQLDPSVTLTGSEKHELVVAAAKSLGIEFSRNFLDAVVKLVLEWSRTKFKESV